MRVMYVLKNRYGTMGMNTSYRVPAAAHRYLDCHILEFVNTKIPSLVVYENPGLKKRQVRDVPWNTRIHNVFKLVDEWHPDIVHVFSIDMIEMAYRHKMRADGAPRWIMDIRSPLLDPKGLSSAQQARNAQLVTYWDKVITHASPSLQSYFGPAAVAHETVSPGLDFKSACAAAPQDTRPLEKFLYVGSIEPKRQLEFLIDGFAALMQKTDVPISLDLFGGGVDHDYITQLEKYAHHRAANKIRIKGLVAQNALLEKIPQYDASLAYVPGGPYVDAPALKLLEGAACGLALFASNNSGLRSSAAENDIAVTFFDNDIDSFVQAVLPQIGTLYDPGLRARNFASAERLDWDCIFTQNYLPIYHGLNGGTDV